MDFTQAVHFLTHHPTRYRAIVLGDVPQPTKYLTGAPYVYLYLKPTHLEQWLRDMPNNLHYVLAWHEGPLLRVHAAYHSTELWEAQIESITHGHRWIYSLKEKEFINA